MSSSSLFSRSLLAGDDRWGRDALVAFFGDEGVAAPGNRLQAGSYIRTMPEHSE